MLDGLAMLSWRSGVISAVLAAVALPAAVAAAPVGAGAGGGRVELVSEFEFAGLDLGVEALTPARHGGWLVAGDTWSSPDAGWFALARLTASGRLDRSAFLDGRAVLRVAPGVSALRDVTALDDGGALLVGYGGWNPDDDDRDDAVIARVRADGTPDSGFGRGGVVRLRTSRRVAPFEVAEAARVLADGKILVAGSDARGAFLARLLTDGRLDARFGAGGIAHPLPRTRDLTVGDLHPAGRRRMLLVGEILRAGALRDDSDTRNFDVAAVRVDRHGRLDRSYGRGGVATIAARGERTRPDLDFLDTSRRVGRRLVIAEAADERFLHAARLRADGRTDTSFGRAGHWRGPRAGGSVEATIDARGRVWFVYARRGRTVVQRLTTDGRTDRRVGRGLSFDAHPGAEYPSSPAVTPSGRLLVPYGGAAVRIFKVHP
jgi:uncharacterized delta-60 repeat protein